MATQNKIKGGMLMIIGFFLVAILGANMLPQAFDTWFNTSTADWDGVTATLWDLTPLFIILGVIFYFVGQAFDLF